MRSPRLPSTCDNPHRAPRSAGCWFGGLACFVLIGAAVATTHAQSSDALGPADAGPPAPAPTAVPPEQPAVAEVEAGPAEPSVAPVAQPVPPQDQGVAPPAAPTAPPPPAPPPASAPAPVAAEPDTEFRSLPVGIVGISLTVGGIVALIAGGFEYAIGEGTQCDCLTVPCDCGDSDKSLGIGSMIGGGIGVGVGVALTVVGFLPVPVEAAQAHWAVPQVAVGAGRLAARWSY